MRDQETSRSLSFSHDFSDTDLSADIPAKKLLALLKTSNEIRESFALNDLQTMLHTAARHVYTLLEAESCEIFLVSEEVADTLVLEASYTTNHQHHVAPVRLKIHNVPGEGLTGYLAHTGEVVRLHGADLTSNPYGRVGNLIAWLPEHSWRCFACH